MTRLFGIVGVFALSGFITTGCNMQELMVNMTAPVLKNATRSTQAEIDPALAREAAPGQLKTVDGFLESAPHNPLILAILAQGYAEYSFGFLEDDLEQIPDNDKHATQRIAVAARATGSYDKALGFALRLIALKDKKRELEAALKKDVTSVEAAVAKLDKKSIHGLFFGGLALASAINLNRTDLGRVADLGKAVAMIKRAYDLDPNFANGGPAMTLGVIKSSQGKAMGGDPDAAKKYFEQAIASTEGKYLLSRVMMARYFAVITENRDLFEKTLKAVIATPADVFPAQRLANELAKRRAERYLKHAEDLF